MYLRVAPSGESEGNRRGGAHGRCYSCDYFKVLILIMYAAHILYLTFWMYQILYLQDNKRKIPFKLFFIPKSS